MTVSRPALDIDTDTQDRIALIGAGPSGLAAARCLSRLGVGFDGFEAHADTGGLWDIANPRSPVCETTHPVTSKARLSFDEHPMPEHLADYPGHRDVLAYLRDYAAQFDLERHFRFGTLVRRIEPLGEQPDSRWSVTYDSGDGPRRALYKGVIVATGIHAEPRTPRFEGRFGGTLMHASQVKRPSQLDGQRVLVIGGGNSGCDTAVDAVARAAYVDLSLRRGYHFLPRHVAGQPADTWRLGLPLPGWLRRPLEQRALQRVVGDPARFGLPPPTHPLHAATAIVNPVILHHLGQGDLRVRPDVERLDGPTVHFKDGSQRDYDLIVAATGYKLHYPFLRAELLNWHGVAPRLHLNTFAPHYQRLAVLGMFEGPGTTWQDRHLQAEGVARYLLALDKAPQRAQAFEAHLRGPRPDLAGSHRFLKLDRMAHHVDGPSFRRALLQAGKRLR